MKKLFFLLAIFSSVNSFAQKEADAIIGNWINIPKQNTIIEVYKVNNEYKGKIIWSKNSDVKKPIGFIILEKLQYSQRSKNWNNGKIHDPNSGKTYSASAKIKNDDILEVNGYIGFKFFGTTKNFKKVQ
jgi:uncharacterized protein (DUF2147 family)